jgi:serine protease Do
MNRGVVTVIGTVDAGVSAPARTHSTEVSMQRTVRYRHPPWLPLLMGCLMALPAHAGQMPEFTTLFKENRAAVVNISTTRKAPASGEERLPALPDLPKDSPFYDFFKRFFRDWPATPGRQFKVRSLGSGFIFSPDGYVLTNAHVIDAANEIVVSLSDRREFQAKVVGKDKASDLALLKIDADHLPVVKIGNSDKLEVGQWVLAIGSPFGFDHSATQGIISALGRSLPDETYVPFIRTDVALNPGNSGGPLFDLGGEVVGVNSQIYSNTGGYMGLSFAIPINMAMDVAQQLKTSGHVARGWLGVTIQEVSQDLAKSFGIGTPRGALVVGVVPDGPARKAGLQPGDIITAFGGRPVDSSSRLPFMVSRSAVGSTVPVTVLRKGKESTLQVTIGQLPANVEEERAGAGGPARPGGRLQIVVADLTPDQRREMGIPYGVLVREVAEGPAARAGIRPGDVIRQVGNTPIRSVAQLRDVIAHMPAGRPVPVLVQRSTGPLFLAVVIPPGQ